MFESKPRITQSRRRIEQFGFDTELLQRLELEPCPAGKAVIFAERCDDDYPFEISCAGTTSYQVARQLG